jgi:hypothetical protein
VTRIGVPADGLPDTFILERLAGDTDPISCDGDSGSLWYDPDTFEGVGLHHGGPSEKGLAVAVSMMLIRSSWDIEPWNGELLEPRSDHDG